MSIEASFLITFVALVLTVYVFVMTLKTNNKSSIHYAFLGAFVCCFILEIESIGVYLLPSYSKLWIIADIAGAGVAPPCFVLAGYFFSHTDKQIKKLHSLLFAIPAIYLILAVTNSYHSLVYVKYSLYLDKIIYGKLIFIFSFYSYLCLIIGFYLFISFSVKNSGLFSKQAFLIVSAFIIPISVNLLAVIGVIRANALIITATLALTMILLWISIIKYKFLNIVPVALRHAIDYICDGFVLISSDFDILDFNKPFLELFKGNLNLKEKRDFIELIGKLGFNSEYFRERINYAFLNIASLSFKSELAFNTESDKSNPKVLCFVIEVSPISHNQTVTGAIILFKDTTKQEEYIEDLKLKNKRLDYLTNELKTQNIEITELNQRLKELAQTDGLTGAYNRRFFNEYYEIEIAKTLNCKKYKLQNMVQTDFSIALLDIDNFKNINDTYGHLVGDKVLKQLVILIKKVVFSRDIVCRYGGEEFAVIFTGTDKKSSVEAAEKIRRVIEENQFYFNKDCTEGHLTVSIGLAGFYEDYINGKDILKTADDRLYKAKVSGKNKVVYE